MAKRRLYALRDTTPTARSFSVMLAFQSPDRNPAVGHFDPPPLDPLRFCDARGRLVREPQTNIQLLEVGIKGDV
jgi:hypothetical protein